MQRRNIGRGRWRLSRLAPSLAIFPQLRRQRNLRVCPGSCSFLTELSQHETDRGEAQERQGLSVEALPILGQAAAAVEPRDGAFDDPSLGQDRKALCYIGALDDLDVDLAGGFCERRTERSGRSQISTNGMPRWRNIRHCTDQLER